MGIILHAGKLFWGDKTLVSTSSLRTLWYSLHAEYANRIRDGTIVLVAENMGISTVLVDSWLEKKSEQFLKKILLCDENGEILEYTKEEIDGLYYHHVFCGTLDLLLPKIQERQEQFRYFVNTLRKQGWQMSKWFENKLLNEGVFLARERDKTKRIPYSFMEKLNIKMR